MTATQSIGAPVRFVPSRRKAEALNGPAADRPDGDPRVRFPGEPSPVFDGVVADLGDPRIVVKKFDRKLAEVYAYIDAEPIVGNLREQGLY